MPMAKGIVENSDDQMWQQDIRLDVCNDEHSELGASEVQPLLLTGSTPWATSYHFSQASDWPPPLTMDRRVRSVRWGLCGLRLGAGGRHEGARIEPVHAHLAVHPFFKSDKRS